MADAPTDDHRPWDRRDDETAKAFDAFCAYLRLGSQRSVVEAYRQTTGRKQADHAPGHWNRWASKHDWTERAAQHDAGELQRDIAARSDARERARQILVDRLPELVEKSIAIALGESITLVETDDGREVPVRASMVEATMLKHVMGVAGLVEVKEVSGPGGSPIKVEKVTLSKDMSVEDIDAAIATRIG